MTSAIGSSKPEHTFPLTSPNGNHSKGSGTEGSATDHPAQRETVHPMPVGPLGHNVNTTA